MSKNSQHSTSSPITQTDEELREELIDKLDDQRMGDNVVNKKLLYKDIEWIIDELLPVVKSHREEYAEERVKKALAIFEKDMGGYDFELAHEEGDDMPALIADAVQNSKRYVLAQLSPKDPNPSSKCPGPTYQPGDMPEDHWGCCVKEPNLKDGEAS